MSLGYVVSLVQQGSLLYVPGLYVVSLVQQGSLLYVPGLYVVSLVLAGLTGILCSWLV